MAMGNKGYYTVSCSFLVMLPKQMSISSKTAQLLSGALSQPKDSRESFDDEYEMDTPYTPVIHETSCPVDEDTPSMDLQDYPGLEDCTNIADGRDPSDPQMATGHSLSQLQLIQI